jgi:hypothetical protein
MIRDDGVRRTARVMGGKPAEEALEAAEAVAALELAEEGGGLPGGEGAASPSAATRGYRSRGAELWGRVRLAMADGALKRLLADEKYSIVSAVFSALFPDDFDRVVPVFNFRETDLLMRKWWVGGGGWGVGEGEGEV